MKRIISVALAVLMLIACLPVIAVSPEAVSENNALRSESTISLGENNILKGRSSTDNIQDIGTDIHDGMSADIESEYTIEELREMSSEELIEKTRDSLPKGLSEYADTSSQYGSLNNPYESENATVRRIMENKQKSNEAMKANIEYGEKLANGEITVTKADHDDKYIVVDDTILITNEDELRGLAGQSGYFRLANDIKLLSPWEPIDFYGTLEGAGYTISAASMEYQTYDYVGFFSLLGETAVVQNLNFDYPYVYANANAGAICAYNQGVISNCNVIGGMVTTYLWASFDEAFWTISGYNVGGICGLNEGYIMNCSYIGDVDGWKYCGGICGTNAGYVFGCYAGGNVAYETNTWDIDYYGAEYTYYNYGEAYYLPFGTMLRDMWASYMLLYHELTAYGYNGGLVGGNYFAIFDCSVQGSGSGASYDLGVVGGLDCMGGLVGGDAGWVSHCYSIDRAFPVFADGYVLYCAWDYGDAGEGIYYDHSYFLVHKGIAINVGEVTCEEDQIFFYGTQGLPCEDGCYHGTELTADQFYDSSTFADWNHGEWNTDEVWIIENGSIPVLMELLPVPEEYVIRYEVANANGLLDGAIVTYKLAHHDNNYKYTEPKPPVASSNVPGYGIIGWHPDEPSEGKAIYGDKVYKAYFGEGGTTGDDDDGGNSGGIGNGPIHTPGPGGPGTGTDVGPIDTNRIGDVNLDGKVNTADAAYLLKAIAEDSLSEFSDKQSTNADTNFDEAVNTADATCILRYCAGLISSFK